MIKGLITKGIGGFYDVAASGETYVCKGRGLFRKDNNILFVGDEVLFEEAADGIGSIREILPRKNCFIRPPVANLDQIIIIMALAKPEPNFLILDRLLVMAEKHQIDIAIGFNKKDLAKEGAMENASSIYSNVYPTAFFCGISGEGVDRLEQLLTGKKTAFAGPSGVGKSTLLNRLHGQASMETGVLSQKTSRGKHTTRHVELFEMPFGGFIFDTPGFTSFDILDAEEDELQHLFPEISPLIGKCRFSSCRHINEPDCAVKAAVGEGRIHPSRYHSYESFYQEITAKRRY